MITNQLFYILKPVRYTDYKPVTLLTLNLLVYGLQASQSTYSKPVDPFLQTSLSTDYKLTVSLLISSMLIFLLHASHSTYSKPVNTFYKQVCLLFTKQLVYGFQVCYAFYYTSVSQHATNRLVSFLQFQQVRMRRGKRFCCSIKVFSLELFIKLGLQID